LDPKGGRHALRDLSIKYTSIGHFNDPFECRPRGISQADVECFVEEAEAAKRDFSKWNDFCDQYPELIERDKAKREKLRKSSRDFMRLFFEQLSDKVVHDINTEFGTTARAASFSGNKKSILMWSHYAQQHEGIVIGYDPRCFDVILPEGMSLCHVIYADEDERVEIPLDLEKHDGLLERIVATKFKDWSYEDEWRSVVLDPTRILGDAISVFPKIPAHFIREVNMGARVDSKLKRVCREFCLKHPDCKLFQAQFDRTKFALLFPPDPK
jgi:hypothetical protein